MNDNPIQKMLDLKERTKSNIDDCLFFIEWVDKDLRKGRLTRKDADKFKKSYNKSIKGYEENIHLIDKFFDEHPYLKP